MDLWSLTGGGLLAGGIALVWWRLHSLAQQVEQCTRRQYYDQSKFQDTARQQAHALTILRVQLAQVAVGKTVDGTLIQEGRLYHQVSADDAGQMVSSKPSATDEVLVIVDVRSQKEFLASHIPGAVHIPLEELETRRHDVPRDAAKVLVYCAQGERSRLACDFLSRQGYMNLVTIHDGLQNWTGPVVGTGPVALIQIQPNGKPAPSRAKPAGHHPHG